MGLAPPTPYQWQVGDIGSAALLNSQLYNGLTFLLNPPAFYGYQNTGQSLNSAAWTAITIDTNVYDYYNGHSTTTNPSRYVCQQAGVYFVCGSVSFVSNSTDMRAAYIAKNGTEVNQTRAQVQAVNGHNSSVGTLPGFVQLNAGDYIEVYGYQGSGGSLSTINDPGTTLLAWFAHA